MPRETREAKSARARRIVAKLDAAMPEARIALEYEDELQLLVAVMLSAQATDAVVNTVTPELFAKYRTAEDYARARVPGVGWKTAGVVVNHAFGTPALPVDTHVGRVSRRLGLTKQEDPDKVEAELSALLPPEQWGRAHQLLIWHGRRTCIARKPHCSRCVVAADCPKVGVKISD